MKTRAFGIAVFPFSWKWGPWKRPHKTIFAVGPLRFVFYRIMGEWKA